MSSARSLDKVLGELLALSQPGQTQPAKERRHKARQLYELTMEAERTRAPGSAWRLPTSDEVFGKNAKTLKQLGLHETRVFHCRDLLSAEDLLKWRRVWAFIMPNNSRRENQGMYVASIDPGVRDFLMIFDANSARLYRIGSGSAHVADRRWQGRRRNLDRECSRIQRCMSGLADEDNALWADFTAYQNRKHRWQKRADREMNALHQSIVTFLVGVFDIIILPEFDVVRMTQKSRRISAGVSRRMRGLHFGQLRDTLIRKCTGRRAKAELFESVDESYSSQCCGLCGQCNKALGASKVFRCLKCENIECRDGGAARKILIKFLLWYAAVPPDDNVPPEMV